MNTSRQIGKHVRVRQHRAAEYLRALDKLIDGKGSVRHVKARFDKLRAVR